MRHRKRKKILDRKKGARLALLKNLASDFVIHEKIRTTSAKAKALRPVIEKFVSLGKENNLTTRRRLLSFFQKPEVVKKILETIGPKYKEKKGGYTRIVKLGRRKGDQAEMAIIEFV